MEEHRYPNERTITIKQLAEVNSREWEKLHKWWEPKMGDLYATVGHTIPKALINNPRIVSDFPFQKSVRKGWRVPLLSIGQLIEFLKKYEYKDDHIGHKYSHNIRKGEDVGGNWSDNLCHTLWERVKGHLKENP